MHRWNNSCSTVFTDLLQSDRLEDLELTRVDSVRGELSKSCKIPRKLEVGFEFSKLKNFYGISDGSGNVTVFQERSIKSCLNRKVILVKK